jgi:hypothetical protein
MFQLSEVKLLDVGKMLHWQMKEKGRDVDEEEIDRENGIQDMT